MGRHRGIALDGVAEHALLPQPPGLALGFAALPEPTLARAVRALGRAVERREITAARARLDSMEFRVVANRSFAATSSGSASGWPGRSTTRARTASSR